jgi:two-component system, cell cycle response regulator DivK
MKKILYVEDNFQNYRLVMRMLTLDDKDFEVLNAPDGASALRLASEEMPDLILMDINLPDMDGTEVTRRLKADAVLQNIPVIALTANAMVGDRERYLESGCDGYLRKPISRDELRETIAAFCEAC